MPTTANYYTKATLVNINKYLMVFRSTIKNQTAISRREEKSLSVSCRGIRTIHLHYLLISFSKPSSTSNDLISNIQNKRTGNHVGIFLLLTHHAT